MGVKRPTLFTQDRAYSDERSTLTVNGSLLYTSGSGTSSWGYAVSQLTINQDTIGKYYFHVTVLRSRLGTNDYVVGVGFSDPDNPYVVSGNPYHSPIHLGHGFGYYLNGGMVSVVGSVVAEDLPKPWTPYYNEQKYIIGDFGLPSNLLPNSIRINEITITTAIDLDSDPKNVIFFVDGEPVFGRDPVTGYNAAIILSGNFYLAPTCELKAHYPWENFDLRIEVDTSAGIGFTPEGYTDIGYLGGTNLKIEGTVYESKTKSPNQIVYLYDRENGELVGSKITDANGYYKFPWLQMREYYLVAIDRTDPKQSADIVDRVWPS